MAIQTVSPPHTASQGTKRSAEDINTTPTKRLKAYHRYHSTHHKQPFEADPGIHCQDETLFQGQLDRALTMVLASAGFDSAKNDALEALRAATQEFMLHFASRVRKAMHSSRRTKPLPQDFVLALTQNMLTSSDLFPHTQVSIPPEIALPRIFGPPSAEPEPPRLDPILGVDLNGKEEQARRPYIPKAFPALPSRHTWKTTPVFPVRETDPRKIRERATQEGVLAEQALRKLAAARKSNLPKRRGGATAAKSGAEEQKKKAWEEALISVLQQDQVEQQRFEERQLVEEGGMDAVYDGLVRPQPESTSLDNGLLVNYDRQNWRKGVGTVIRA